MNQSRKYFLLSLQIIVSILLIFFTFSNTHFHKVLLTIKTSAYYYFIPAILSQLAMTLCMALREQFLLKKLHYFTFKQLIQGVFIGIVGNNLLPFRSGELLKVFYWREKSSKSYPSLLSVAFLERFFDIIFLAIILLTIGNHLIRQLKINTTAMQVTIIIICLCIIFFLLFEKFNRNKTKPTNKVITQLSNLAFEIGLGFKTISSLKNLCLFIFFTILYWFFSWASIAFMLKAFYISLNWQMPLTIMVILAIGIAIPSAPGNIGVFEYFAKQSLVIFGINQSIAASFAITTHVIFTVPIVLIGIGFVWHVMSELKIKQQLTTSAHH